MGRVFTGRFAVSSRGGQKGRWPCDPDWAKKESRRDKLEQGNQATSAGGEGDERSALTGRDHVGVDVIRSETRFYPIKAALNCRIRGKKFLDTGKRGETRWKICALHLQGEQ